MLEKYFKNEDEFNEYLDETYSPDKFERESIAFLDDMIAEDRKRFE